MLWSASLFAPVAVLAQAPPTYDTFSYSAQPSKNFGAYPILLVEKGATSYLQFNLSAFPANASVSKAVLRLYVDSVGQAGTLDAYEIDSPWTESQLTASECAGHRAFGDRWQSCLNHHGQQRPVLVARRDATGSEMARRYHRQ